MQSANGLPFASDVTSIEDIPDGVATVKFAQLSVDGSTPATVQVTFEDISFDDNGTDDAADDTITLTIDGEQIVFRPLNPEEDEGFFVATRGEQEFVLDLSANAVGEFSAILSIYSDFEGTQLDAFTAIGFETNPALLPQDGAAFYDGRINGYGTARVGDSAQNLAVFDGQIEFTVNFGSGQIDGETGINVSTESGFNEDYTFFMRETTVSGNGFASDFNSASVRGGVITGNDSSVGGAFFGPAGEELSGVASFDVRSESEGVESQFVGVGGFVTFGEPLE